MQPLLDVRNLTTRLRLAKGVATVVDQLSFALFPGKTLALVGESGCGKSMAALSLLRILPQPPALPSEGEVLYRRTNLLALTEPQMRQIRGRKIAMIFQDPTSCLNPVFTIGDQLMEAAMFHHEREADPYEVAIDALKAVAIAMPEERMIHYPHQLSGGMRQRVMIAMALIGEPEILIADEPTTALDVTIQGQILDLLRRLQEERGMALLLITHDMGVVAEMAHEVVVMYAARGVERGAALQIFDHPSHPYTQALFAARPQRAGKEKGLQSIEGVVPSIMDYPSGCRFHPRCPRALARCKEEVPPRFSLPARGHETTCWLYGKESQHG